VGERGDRIELDLGDILAVELEVVDGDVDLPGDVGDRLE
jgi:hypothetical protein